MSLCFTTLPSVIGDVHVAADEQGLRAIHLGSTPPDPTWRRGSLAGLSEAVAQLTAYFAGDLTEFDLPLVPVGTPFQRRVWQALIEVPYGETATYGELAARIGSPKASRAVGAANGKNPIAIVIPCHRVIGKNGTLTGYAGGLEVKRKLLSLEGAWSGVLV